MLCALCSIAPEMGITKGRGQNISAAQNKRSCPVSLQKGCNNLRQRFSALAFRFYRLTVRKGSAQCFVVIHLYGAEINAEFSEQHRAHLALLL